MTYFKGTYVLPVDFKMKPLGISVCCNKDTHRKATPTKKNIQIYAKSMNTKFLKAHV